MRIAFDVTERLRSQCAAYDFVFNAQNEPVLVEVSYGFVKEVYDPCVGYWDRSLQWHEGPFNPQRWMVDVLIKSIGKDRDRIGSAVLVGDD